MINMNQYLLLHLVVLLAMACKQGGCNEETESTVASATMINQCKDFNLATFWKNALELKKTNGIGLSGFYMNASEVRAHRTNWSDKRMHLKFEIGALAKIRTVSIVLKHTWSTSKSICTAKFEKDNFRNDDNNLQWNLELAQCIKQNDSIIYNSVWPPETFQITTHITLSTCSQCNVQMGIGIVDDQFYLHYFERELYNLPHKLNNEVEMQNPYMNKRLKRDTSERDMCTNYDVYLVIANAEYIQQLSLDGRRANTAVCTLVQRAVAIDYNFRDQHIFWTDVSAKNIMRSNLNGSEVTTIANLSTEATPDGLAVDWITNKLYWTDTGQDIINVLDLNTNIRKTLIDVTNGTTNAAEPRAIAIDPFTRWMYWTDWGSTAKIEKSSMDGRNRSVIHTTGLVWPNGLTLDFQNQVLYWADASLDKIESSNVDGSNRRLINSFNSDLHPYGLALFDGVLYFTDWTGPSVKTVDPTTGNVTNGIIGLYGQPFGIRAVSEERQPTVFNPCAVNNGGCSHLCLLSAVNLRGYSCNCPDRMMLDLDGHSCIAIHPSEVIQQPHTYLINSTCARSLPILTTIPQGSCVSAGHRNCCTANNCQGEPNNCYCDYLCTFYGDCCPDANTDCDNTGLQFTKEPQNQTVYEEDRVHFHCSVQSSNEPKRFNWEFRSSNSDQSQVIAADSMGPLIPDKYAVEVGKSSSKLTVLLVELYDAGIYNCRVSAAGESIQAHAYLDILVPPRGIMISGSNVFAEEAVITLSCEIVANPKPTVTWLKRDTGELRRLMNSSRISIYNSYEGRTFTHQSILTIQHAQEADSGEYLCEVLNAPASLPIISSRHITISARNDCRLGDDVTSPCKHGGLCVDLVRDYHCICSRGYQGPDCADITTANITTPPNITQPPLATMSELASPINLTCTAEGNPVPSYEWYKDGILIPGEHLPFLYIPEVLPNDRGNYSCKAINVNSQKLSEPALLTIRGVYQYSAQLQLLAGTDNIDEVLLQVANSDLSLSSAFIHSVQIISSIESREVTLQITVVLPTKMGINTSDPSQTMLRLQSDLYSQLLQVSSIRVIGIARYDGCNQEIFRGYEWPEINLGNKASIPCPCAEFSGSLAGRIFRYCIGTFSQQARWSVSLDNSQCTALNSAQTGLLCEAAQNASSAAIEASKLVVEITATPYNLTAADLSVSIAVVDQLTDEAIANPEVRKNYLQIIDNIQQTDHKTAFISQNATNSSSRVLESISEFLDTLAVNETEDRVVFGYSTYALQIQSIDSMKLSGHALTVNLGSVKEAINSGQINKEDLITGEGLMSLLTNATASVYIPTFNNVNSCHLELLNTSQQRLSHSVFLSDILFQSHIRNNYSVGSIIVSARTQCLEDVFLPVPITATFRTNPQIAKNASDRVCARWDSSQFGVWSTEGCTEIAASGDTIICECNYMAHFGILFDLSPAYTSDNVALALTVFSYVGLSMSLLCLSVFILTYLCAKNLRSSTHGQILVNMSLALTGLYVFFLISGHITSVPPLCGISSALLQYFLLVFFGWTAAEAVWLYLKLVKVFGIQSCIANFSLKAAIPTWVVPMLIVILTAGPGHMYYTSPFYCRATEWPFWFGTILPFALVYIFNWIMFIIIMISVCKHTQSIKNSKDKEGRSKSTRNNLTVAATLAFVFGLGWAIGLAATSLPIEEITYVFQIIFCILVGAQGVLIFFLQGVRNKDFRQFWRQALYNIGHKTHPAFTTTKMSAAAITSINHGTDMAGIATLSNEKVGSSERGHTAVSSSAVGTENEFDVKTNEAYGSLPERYINTSFNQQPSEYEEVHIYDPVTY